MATKQKSRYQGASNKLILTSIGERHGLPNAMVAGGESIIDNIYNPSDTVGHVITRGKRGQDTNYANLKDDTIVLGNDRDWRNGIKFMDQALPYTHALEQINKKYEWRGSSKINDMRGSIGKKTDEINLAEINKIKEPIVEKLKDLADQQRKQHEYELQILSSYAYHGRDYLPKYWFGKNIVNWVGLHIVNPIGNLFKKKPAQPDDGQVDTSTIYDSDKGENNPKDQQRDVDYGRISPINGWSNAITGLAGMGMSLNLYFDAKRQDIRRQQSYASNPYENQALSVMANTRIDPYATMRQMQDVERRSMYATNRAGGLSGGQKYLANVATALGSQRNVGDAFMNIQAQNNKYRQDYANMAAQIGALNALRMQQAKQWDEDYMAKAHAARQQGMQMGMQNFLGQMQQYAANEYKRLAHNGMLSLYQSDQQGAGPTNNASKAQKKQFRELFNDSINGVGIESLPNGDTFVRTPVTKNNDDRWGLGGFLSLIPQMNPNIGQVPVQLPPLQSKQKTKTRRRR